MLNSMFKYNEKTNHWILDFKIFKIKFKKTPKKNENIKYSIIGLNNKVLLVDTLNESKLINKKIKGLEISVNGNNNNITIANDCIFNNTKIIVNANNCTINIGHNCRLNNLNIMALFGNSQQLHIEEKVVCLGANIHLKDEQASVYIGANTLLSHDIHIWATDGHALIDNTSKKCLNFPTKGIRIGSNCWITFGVTITKGAEIQDNTVVGACSVLTKSFNESNILLAGNPAKIIKHNINWDPRPPYTYISETKNLKLSSLEN